MKIKPNKIPTILLSLKFECGGVLYTEETKFKLKVTRSGTGWSLDQNDNLQSWVQGQYIKACEVFEDYYKENPELEPKLCCSCGYDEDDIDDHTSVWGGAGPDCIIEQREAAK